MDNTYEKNDYTEENVSGFTPKLKMFEKLTFGLGDFGANFSWTFIASFITIYMTDTVGIGAGIIGTIILFSRVFDGFTDIFMGTIIDNTNTKMGKAKPWVFWTAPILGILTFMLFNVPDMGQTGKVIYVFIVYILISAIFYTANNVAYSSLTSFMTTDEKDRTSLGSIRFIFANAAVLFISSFTTVLVNSFGSGQKGWTYTALIYGLLCAIPLMLTGYFVKERNVAKNHSKEQRISFITIFKSLLSNKHFNIALVLYLLWYLRQTESAARIYYAAYVFKNENLMGVLSAASLVPLIIGLLFAPYITGKLGLKKSVLTGLFVSVVGYIIMTVFSENVAGFVIGSVINGFGLAPLQAGLTTIVADVGDIVYWKSGVPVQGSVFSITSAGMKIGQGITAALVGWSLQFGGYIANTTIQPDSSIFAMKVMTIYFPFIIVIGMIIVVLLMNYDKLMPKIREDINNGNVGNK
ncbi:MFS transporter [Enterococcus faecium]|uniref:MFS transporter n=1 Tax=Enterococcus faecium TaxID=1352 RepID=UPI001E2B6D0F|nr:glycoside-pentoside-hexuronide (GPH):cation symporter [Enterococcus faecium]MCD5100549.1 MFS transporter [Enterococcus faecium]MCD5218196.1 MFS transporter [Enterococcus faecium]